MKINLISLPSWSWKLGRKTCLERILIAYQEVRTSSGIVFLQRDGPGESFWASTTQSLIYPLLWKGNSFFKFHLRNKSDDFKWILMAIYGLAQDEFKTAFLSEMVRTCQQNPLPTLIGGDFNIMRHSGEKTKDNFNHDGLSYSMLSLIVSIFGKLI